MSEENDPQDVKDRIAALNLKPKDLRDIQGRIIRLDSEDKILKRWPKITWENLQDIRLDMSPATDATKRHLKRDPLKALYANGTINEFHLEAASAIQTAWRIITDEMAIKTQSYDMRVDGSGAAPSAERIGEVILIQKYKIWANMINPRHVKAVLEVLTQPVTLMETDRRNNFRNGKTAEIIAFSLDYYLSL